MEFQGKILDNERDINNELIYKIVDWIDFCYKEINTVYNFAFEEILMKAKRDENYYYLYKIAIEPVANFKFENIKIKLYFINERGSRDLREHIISVASNDIKKIIANDVEWFELLYIRLCEVLNNNDDYFFSAKNVKYRFSINGVIDNLKGKEFFNIGFFDYILAPDFSSSSDFRLNDNTIFGKSNATLVVRFGRCAEQIYFNLNTDMNRLLDKTTIIKEKFFKEVKLFKEETEREFNRTKETLSVINNVLDNFSEEDRLLFEVNV